MAVLGFAPAEGASALRSETEPGRPIGRVTASNVLRLLEWQQYRCALTGRELTPETASLDHIVPVRSGGEHRIENTQILHRDVNRAKTTMTNDEFIQLCQEIVAHTRV
jgi:5-methylcytosine-specific restriction endonuclease McrA